MDTIEVKAEPKKEQVESINCSSQMGKALAYMPSMVKEDKMVVLGG